MSDITTSTTAVVATDAPVRYAKQLVSHLGRKLEICEAERGQVLTMDNELGRATCLFDVSDAQALRLEVEGTTAEVVERLAGVVGSHLERFGAKNELQVTWS